MKKVKGYSLIEVLFSMLLLSGLSIILFSMMSSTAALKAKDGHVENIHQEMKENLSRIRNDPEILNITNHSWKELYTRVYPDKTFTLSGRIISKNLNEYKLNMEGTNKISPINETLTDIDFQE